MSRFSMIPSLNYLFLLSQIFLYIRFSTQHLGICKGLQAGSEKVLAAGFIGSDNFVVLTAKGVVLETSKEDFTGDSIKLYKANLKHFEKFTGQKFTEALVGYILSTERRDSLHLLTKNLNRSHTQTTYELSGYSNYTNYTDGIHFLPDVDGEAAYALSSQNRRILYSFTQFSKYDSHAGNARKRIVSQVFYMQNRKRLVNGSQLLPAFYGFKEAEFFEKKVICMKISNKLQVYSVYVDEFEQCDTDISIDLVPGLVHKGRVYEFREAGVFVYSEDALWRTNTPQEAKYYAYNTFFHCSADDDIILTQTDSSKFHSLVIYCLLFLVIAIIIFDCFTFRGQKVGEEHKIVEHLELYFARLEQKRLFNE